MTRRRCAWILGPLVWAAFAFASAHALDLNTANRSELEQLPRIGVARAEAILSERERNGPFNSWEDFARRVPGQGPKSVEHLKARGVTIEPRAAAQPAAAP